MLILIALLFGFLIASLTEYLLHRYYLHFTGKHMHILEHHKHFNGNHSYSSDQSRFKDIVSGFGYILVNTVPYLLVAGFIKDTQPVPALILASTGLLYTFWVEAVHYLFHHPLCLPLESTGFYLKLKEHHRMHHVVYRNNYGIGSRFWDRILNSIQK